MCCRIAKKKNSYCDYCNYFLYLVACYVYLLSCFVNMLIVVLFYEDKRSVSSFPEIL